MKLSDRSESDHNHARTLYTRLVRGSIGVLDGHRMLAVDRRKSVVGSCLAHLADSRLAWTLYRCADECIK